MRERRIALLGATGSIGRQALEVIAANPELERLRARVRLAAARRPRSRSSASSTSRSAATSRSSSSASEPDLVLNAVVGFAGVGATLWALERGVTLALANKESLVAAGDLAVAAWKRGGGLLLPVDSEHSALFQCLEGRAPETIDSVVLTASGGPFRNRPLDELESVTVEEALAHPTWSMGPKITVDSATLANKGLELIEAHYLFGARVRADRGRRPSDVGRARARALPRRRRARASRVSGHARADLVRADAIRSGGRRRSRALDFSVGPHLEFAPPDPERYPLLRLAREAGERGGTYPARSTRRTRSRWARSSTAGPFLEIAPIVEDALDGVDGAPARDLAELVVADGEARRLAEGKLARSCEHLHRDPRPRVPDPRARGGHFFASLAVGLRPRRFYVGFPPAIAKTKRNGSSTGSERSRSAAS